ncbi:hypothetical protein DFH11DRAFT_1541592 [Phellopilus nigrolimitatus]|nr:hypothetical protein DFH11DRAFT_1541592 [Phellopilus nigrolimitatus]
MVLTAIDILYNEEPLPSPLAHDYSSAGRAHGSSASNREYEPIYLPSLKRFPSPRLDQFYEYISKLSANVDFADVSPKYRHLPGIFLRNEADVRSYLDAAIVRPVWPVILSMLPPDKDYDWALFQERAHGDDINSKRSSADIAIVRLSNRGSWREEFSLLLELKAPLVVDGLLRMFAHQRTDTSDDWETITRQIRKYAVTKGCRHHILMDDRTAIYFRFVRDRPDNEYHSIFYAYASAPSIGMRVRELLAFAAWNSIGDMDPDNISTPILQKSQRASEVTVKGDLERLSVTSPWLSLHLRLCTSVRLQSGDYVGEDNRPLHPKFKRHSELRLLAEEACGSDSVPDSGYHTSKESNDDDSILVLRPFPFFELLPLDVEVRVVDSFKAKVMVVSSPSGVKYVLKRFTRVLCDLEYELFAYTALWDLQGKGVPRCLGLCTVDNHTGFFLCLEFIPYDTLKSVTDKRRIEAAKAEASELLNKIHARGIRHNDLSVSSNILLAKDTTIDTGKPKVYIVDFAYSRQVQLSISYIYINNPKFTDDHFAVDRRALNSSFNRAITAIEERENIDE